MPEQETIVCPYCKNNINPEQSKFMYPLEKPYMNIYFHLECYKNIEDMLEFLQNNTEIWYNIKDREVKNGRRNRKNK